MPSGRQYVVTPANGVDTASTKRAGDVYTDPGPTTPMSSHRKGPDNPGS